MGLGPRRAPPNDVDYGPLVAAAGRATFVLLGVKLLTMGWLAHGENWPGNLRWFSGVIPYVSFFVERAAIVRLESLSTLALAVTMLVSLAVVIFRGRRRQVVAGWSIGVVALAELLLVEWIRHLLDPPFLDVGFTVLSLLCLLAGLVLSSGWALVELRARDAQHDSAPVSTARISTPPALLYRKEEGTRP